MDMTGMYNTTSNNYFTSNMGKVSSDNTIQSAGTDTKSMTHSDFMDVISERIDDIYNKLQSGDTKTSYQIGGASYTNKEWDKLIDKFDKTEEKFKKALEEEIEKLKDNDEKDDKENEEILKKIMIEQQI